MAYSRIRFEIQNSATMTLVQFAFGYPFKNGHAKVTLQGHEEVVPGSNGEMHIWQSEQWFCIDRSGRRVDCIETPLKP